jgi:hypothetical protein
MSDVTRVITLGIGPDATVEAYILTGLNVTSLIYTALSANVIKRNVSSLDVDKRLSNDVTSIKRNVSGDMDRR